MSHGKAGKRSSLSFRTYVQGVGLRKIRIRDGEVLIKRTWRAWASRRAKNTRVIKEKLQEITQTQGKN